VADLPDNYAVASGFVPAGSSDVWSHVSDLENFSAIFPEWIAAIEADDDRFHATGPKREKYDLYPQHDAEHHALNIEVVDELGSADTMKLRVLDIPGGSLVLLAHGKLSGTSDSAWVAKRDAVASGLSALSLD
jgi:hypothetical protein